MSDLTPVSINLEFTPNPNTLKFVVNRQFMERGAANFPDASKAEQSPLAKRLFEVPGISAVLIGTNFVTITKGEKGDWDILAERVPQAIEAHAASGEKPFSAEMTWEAVPAAEGASEIEMKIRAVLDQDIRPAVAMDGGDITFGKFEDGIVYLHLQGACSSCPSSIATLKMGVEARLRDAVPEVKEVVQV
jgi:Fe-S cluster biogenesis protein NfuA